MLRRAESQNPFSPPRFSFLCCANGFGVARNSTAVKGQGGRRDAQEKAVARPKRPSVSSRPAHHSRFVINIAVSVSVSLGSQTDQQPWVQDSLTGSASAQKKQSKSRFVAGRDVSRDLAVFSSFLSTLSQSQVQTRASFVKPKRARCCALSVASH